MTTPLLNPLASAPLLADGAMGTLLHAHGIEFDRCFDELNLSQPALVASLHRAYLDAGSQIIETNTFGANRYKLARHGARLVRARARGIGPLSGLQRPPAHEGGAPVRVRRGRALAGSSVDR